MEQLRGKKTVLASLFNERAKGALIRAWFSSIREIDAPSSYFFNLEKKEGERKLVTFETTKSSQVNFIYIALLTIQIVTKQLHNIKMGK